jgi:hypothetical protein
MISTESWKILYQMWRKKKANAYGGIKELYIKLQPIILFQSENQLKTESHEF